MKKYFLYYGTEENAYEIDKQACDTLDEAVNAIARWMEDEDDLACEETIDKEKFKKVVNEDGYAIVETENSHGYHIVMGVAVHGHCKEISGLLRDYRRDFIACF
jgi:hypothetical protein